jgi:hypothetical protein
MGPKEKKLFGKILSAIANHERGLSALAAAMSYYTAYLHSMMKRCEVAGCKDVATVKNEALSISVCDNCAARAVVKGLRGMTSDPTDKLNDVRAAAASIDRWQDLPEAESIRMIDKHNNLIAPVHEVLQ